jgi:hypothetical protein
VQSASNPARRPTIYRIFQSARGIEFGGVLLVPDVEPPVEGLVDRLAVDPRVAPVAGADDEKRGVAQRDVDALVDQITCGR